MQAPRPEPPQDNWLRQPIYSAYARVDPQAIAHNLQTIRQHLGLENTTKKPLFWAVVKADAYGHGLELVLPGLHAADGLAVLTLSDAYRCRALGWTRQILIMGGDFTDAALSDPALYPLHLVAEHAGQLDQLERFSGAQTPHVWLRFSGNLHHAGFQARDYQPSYARLQALQAAGRLTGIGHLQHYAGADDAEQLAAERQAFATLTAGLPGQHCTENSAALLSMPKAAAQTDWLRTGVALYGISPLAGVDGPGLGLEPAMALQAPIYGVQALKAGDSVGYHGGYRADRALRIGLLRCGYADGYPRTAPTGCPVLVDGVKTRIVGKVSMDTLAIDLTLHPGIGPGQWATLWGTRDLPVEHIALAAGTIAAQLLTGLTARVPRQLAGGA